MSQRRELDQHRHSLSDIREIMNSMKTLAYMETRKLARFIDTQHAVVASIEQAAGDLLSWYPDILPPVKPSACAWLLIGSERGFCGDFNHALLAQLEDVLHEQGATDPILIAVGRKLFSLLDGDSRLAAVLEGASTVEDVTGLLSSLVTKLTELEAQYQGLNVYCLYHDSEGKVAVKLLLPPFQSAPETSPRYSHAPVVNVPAPALFGELSQHYLFAVLYQMLYTSLHAENHNRVTHMEGAVRHLDEKAERLDQRYNVLRQEEITEEIEVILLNAANLEGYSYKKYR